MLRQWLAVRENQTNGSKMVFDSAATIFIDHLELNNCGEQNQHGISVQRGSNEQRRINERIGIDDQGRKNS